MTSCGTIWIGLSQQASSRAHTLSSMLWESWRRVFCLASESGTLIKPFCQSEQTAPRSSCCCLLLSFHIKFYISRFQTFRFDEWRQPEGVFIANKQGSIQCASAFINCMNNRCYQSWRHPLVCGLLFWSLQFGFWPSPSWFLEPEVTIFGREGGA